MKFLLIERESDVRVLPGFEPGASRNQFLRFALSENHTTRPQDRF
jgi:hypothetical protein